MMDRSQRDQGLTEVAYLCNCIVYQLAKLGEFFKSSPVILSFVSTVCLLQTGSLFQMDFIF